MWTYEPLFAVNINGFFTLHRCVCVSAFVVFFNVFHNVARPFCVQHSCSFAFCVCYHYYYCLLLACMFFLFFFLFCFCFVVIVVAAGRLDSFVRWIERTCQYPNAIKHIHILCLARGRAAYVTS